MTTSVTNDTVLCSSIVCHAWNHNATQIALSPNTDETWIYATPTNDIKTWKRLHVLREHGGLVSGIDWSHITNCLVTCSHDRNAYVWSYETQTDTWKPTLVILRINRAATCVKWSPSGSKFAVGSGAKCVPVCHFEASNDWWISKMIKKHKSTVTSIAWSPNSVFLVTGSTDLKIRIFSAFLDGIDEPGSVEANHQFGAKAQGLLTEFGACLAEFDCGHAWIHSVAWSPSGNCIAAASHASVTAFISLNAEVEPALSVVWSRSLPFLDLAFVNETTLVAAGFDGALHVFSKQGEQWCLKQRLTGTETTAVAGASTSKSGGISNARAMFAAAADRGQSAVFASGSTAAGNATKSEISSCHANSITSLRFLSKQKQITTSGLDGRVVYWPVGSFLTE